MATSHKQPLRWAVMERCADALLERLNSACRSITVAGSFRRREPIVRDLEIVAVPHYQADLFGGPAESLLDVRLRKLTQEGMLSRPLKSGERYKQFTLAESGVQLDLFIAQPDNLGLILALRTGPGEFSKRLVTQQAHGGLLHDGLRIAEGYVWQNRFVDDDEVVQPGERIATPDEAAFFALTVCGWIDPCKRGKA